MPLAHKPSRELELLLKCAHPDPGPEALGDINSLALNGLDWPNLLRLARYHQLLPLTYSSLGRALGSDWPEEPRKQFRRAYEFCVKRNLAQTAEFRRLTAALNDQGVDVAVVKGIGLARRLYGKSTLRSAADIDVMVRIRDVPTAVALLRHSGYRETLLPENLDLASRTGRLLLKGVPEFGFKNPDRGIHVDLHWGFATSNHELDLDLDAEWDNMPRNEICGLSVRTLPPETLFIYLCYHGTKHRWMRLHWLCDLSLLMRQPGIDWPMLFAEAKARGVAAPVGLGLALAHRLFEAPLPTGVKNPETLLGRGGSLSERILPDLLRVPPGQPRAESFLGILTATRWGWRIHPSAAARINQWLRLLRPTPRDVRSIRLPDRLAWIYYGVRPLRVLGNGLRYLLTPIRILRSNRSIVGKAT